MKKIIYVFCYVLIGMTSFAQPAITTFSPTSGAIGSNVTLTGTGFNTIPTQNIVFFGATQAVVTTASTTSLTVEVPLGATYDYISVTNLAINLTAYSRKPFTVTLAGHIAFAAKVDFATGAKPQYAEIGDVDGDGKSDLVTTKTISHVGVMPNTSTAGTVNFASPIDFLAITSRKPLDIGDIDGDGKPDLVLGNYSAISVFRNISTLGSAAFAAKVDFGGLSGAEAVAIGDLNADGKPDIAIANSGDISVFENVSTLGGINFIKKFNLSGGTVTKSVSIGDIDGDGKPDLVTTDYASNTVSVFRNTSVLGNLSYTHRINFVTGPRPYSVSIGDVDGDGKLDLVTANRNGNTISVLRNTSTLGTISFANKIDFPGSNQPYLISMGDIDGDGKPDLAVTNNAINTVSIFRNTSTSGIINFDPKVDFVTSLSPTSVNIGDIDGDGKPDLTIGNVNNNNISVLRQIVPLPPPEITSFSPLSGCANADSIIIIGTNFTEATTVTFGGVNALSFTVDSATQITAIVGSGNTGEIAVTTPSGTGTSIDTFIVNPSPDLTTTQNGVLITANQNGATYQWIDCSNNASIVGATNQDYTATVTGDYAVVVGLGTCIDTSLCLNVNVLEVTKTAISDEFSIYPNPFSIQTTLSASGSLSEKTFILYNSFGQEVKKLQNISEQRITFNRGDLPSGLYFIQLMEGSKVIEVKKLMIIE